MSVALGFIGSIGLGFFAILGYPVKRFLRRRRVVPPPPPVAATDADEFIVPTEKVDAFPVK